MHKKKADLLLMNKIHLMRRMDLPRFFMILRKDDMTVEIGCNSTVAFPLLSAFTIVRNALFSIILPILL